MATIATSFTSAASGDNLLIKDGDSFTYSLSGTFVATILLEHSEDGINYAQDLSLTAAASGTIENTSGKSLQYRFRCIAYTSGTAVTSIADVDEVVYEIPNKNGDPIFQVTEAGVVINGTQSVSGASTLSGAVAEGAAATTSVGVGAKNGSTVTAVENGNGVVHKTVLTLASTPVTVTSTGSANGFGGAKLYDFPEGHIRLLGCVADLSMAIAAAEQSNFTDGTPEGDVGVGSVIIANADAMGTDATDDDMATAAAFTMTDYADASVVLAPEAALNFDGSSTAVDANLNVLVDAADIADDASTEVEVSGTVTIHWINLGDY